VALGAAGVSLAAAARPQASVIAATLLVGLVARTGWRRAVPGLVVVASAAATLMAFQWWWFGSVLGAARALQDANLEAHAVSGTLAAKPWVAAAGLLVSPSRGLIVFSPVVLFAAAALPSLWRRRTRHGEAWWLAAALVQTAAYSCYSMWWGGHTYGPRYLVDVMVPLAPAAAVGVSWAMARRWRSISALVILAYSIVVAATGAFVYPAEGWNRDPDVDRAHERLWDWRDPQVIRCWRTGPSPQNFSLLDWEAVRRSPADRR
jgi:hypothetical protein